MRWAALVLVLVALPVAAQELDPEPEPVEVEVVEEEARPRFALAGWCPLRSGQREQAPDQAAEGEGAEEGEQVGEQAGDEEQLGCDAGVGYGLVGRDFAQGRLSLVGVLGAKSLGFGVAWTFGDWRRPVSVALGLVAPYDQGGVYGDEAALAVGATVGVGGPR